MVHARVSLSVMIAPLQLLETHLCETACLPPPQSAVAGEQPLHGSPLPLAAAAAEKEEEEEEEEEGND